MSAICPIGFDSTRLLHRIRTMYEEVAERPERGFHFHTGGRYAIEMLGYDPVALARIPEASRARFAGVGNPLRIAPIACGARVLDHACGAGTDLLLAALQAGPNGHAIGIDLTPAMRAVTAASIRALGLEDHVEVRDGTMEALPCDDESVDVVISNGVLNLATDKLKVLSEVRRVLRPGGRLLLADVVLGRELAPQARSDPDLWAACVGGALTEAELPEVVAAAGLRAGRLVEHFDCFRGTALASKLGAALGVRALTYTAQK